MPTHIVIRTVPSAPLERTNGSLKNRNEPLQNRNEPNRSKNRTPIQQGVVGFRSSVRKETTHMRRCDDENLHLSRNDLRASQRLHGYLYMLVASIVMLVTAVDFYMERNKALQEEEDGKEESTDDDSIQIFGSRVLSWKLYGALIVSAAGVGISLFILLVHFDSICCPRLWKCMFRDGSKSELCLLLALFLFWVAGLHICTSSFSVGEVSPNVYFTTWIAFASVAMNVGVWRTSADLPLIIDKLKNHERETMYSWFRVLVFGMVTSLSIAELYANRDELEVLLDGQVQKVPQEEWNKALGVSFSAVGIALLNMICNHCLSEPLRFKVCGTTFNLDWRQVEGFLAFGLIGAFAWFIFKYTGVNGALNGPSNPYFGSWGTWFCSIFTFGTWLRENKHIEMFLREPDGGQGRAK